MLLELEFSKHMSYLLEGFFVSFVAKWSFLTVAQLAKFQRLGFDVAFCVKSDLCS